MKIPAILVAAILTIFPLISGCNQTEAKKLKQENSDLKAYNSKLLSQIDDLKAKNAKLVSEIDDLKYGASRLLARGKQNYKDSNWDTALSQLTMIIQKFPESAEAKNAKSLIIKVKGKIQQKKIEEELERKRQDKKRAERLSKAMSNLEKRIDRVEDITWYMPKNTPKSHTYEGTCFYVYIGVKDGHAWKRLAVRYDSDEWIFFDKILVKADGLLYDIPFNKYRDKKSDSGGGGVTEWVDIEVTPSLESALDYIADAKSAVVRLQGKYTKDFTLNSQQKNAIKTVLIAFPKITNAQ